MARLIVRIEETVQRAGHLVVHPPLPEKHRSEA